MRWAILCWLVAACADEIVCGPGTVRQGTECVTGTPVEPCGDAGLVLGGNCYRNPEVLCGSDSVWDPVQQRCKGDGGGGGCASACSPADSRKVCVAGHVTDFTNPTVPATSQSGLRVRAYDPIVFATNPNAPVLGMSDVRDDGCFAIDGIDRPSSGLIAVSATDAGNPRGGVYVIAGGGAILQPNRNVTDLKAYFISVETEQLWEAMVTSPTGCPTMLECGMWIGFFLDSAGHPVAGVTPARPGDIVPSETIFCFRGDRLHLSAEDTTDATGLCMIVADSIGSHTGLCGGAPCSPPFPTVTAGSAAHVIFIQEMRQQ